MSSINPRTPVIVGVAQCVDRESDPEAAASPLDFLEQVTRGAARDSGAGERLLQHIDRITVIRTFADSGASAFRLPGWSYPNLPRSLAERIGAKPAKLTYPHPGGNTPQWSINLLADAIAAGEADICLLAGAENMRTAARAQRRGIELNWTDDPGGDEPDTPGSAPPASTKSEHKHGLSLATSGYAMFENALADRYGRSPAEHRAALGRLMERFSEIAAANPFSISSEAKSALQIAEPGEDNRYIAYPYTKYLCSNMFVDQAAAVLLMSEAAADRLDVPREKRVYLHGSAETTEKWFLSDRIDFSTAPSVEIGARAALEQAGISVEELTFLDLYSCFASPVEIAADALGIAHDDPRGLTVTGGLVCFGGPGNNYVTHAVASMVEKLRQRPGSNGLIFGNGYFLTKHAFGVYSTRTPEQLYRRREPAIDQHKIDDLPSPPFDETPAGTAVIETYTVLFEKGAPRSAPVFARLEGSGARCLATIIDPASLEAMVDETVIGRRIEISAGSPINTAKFI
ncbi:acetyl-CoA acetyltransferase [Altererythrobacter sp. Z27]|uniref:acetyl-CoA acetyltransferase n=1 Tax=Altererythrobacter sp. Z27 TaxID=3461147 RepID=UPI004044B90F